MEQPNWQTVTDFEKAIASFFGAPYAVAVDSCTHGIELCLRLTNATKMIVPVRTYVSVPMLSKKIGLKLEWCPNYSWQDYYILNDENGNDIIDAAVLWKKDSYLNHLRRNVFMCISFQYQKTLSLGRGGMILCPNEETALQLKKMSYDGRLPGIPWREQDIDTMGYHYYLTPETAKLGLDKLQRAIDTPPRIWSYLDYPDLTKMSIFSNAKR